MTQALRFGRDTIFAPSFPFPEERAFDLEDRGEGEIGPDPGDEAGSGDRKKTYRAVWISDLHLGTRGCKAHMLKDFLARHDCEDLYLVGDIVDGWRLKKSWYWNEDQNGVVRAVLKKSKLGTRVHYVCGNHDEFLRDYVGLTFGGVVVQDQAVHELADGRRMLVMHGDQFDCVIRNAKWLALLGDHAYRGCLALNLVFNGIRRRLGLGYWSLSAYLKGKVKNAVSYVGKFEEAVVAETSERGFDAVVCGHIHHAEMREVDGVLYCNDGDWVESCTALVEHLDGRLEILRWADVLEREAAEQRARRQEALVS